MQRLALVVAILIVLILFAAEGFAPRYNVPTAADVAAGGIYSEDSGIETALTEIYFNVGVMGIKNATADSLKEDFETDPALFGAVYGKYTDGRFGIADVLIVQPRYGREEAVIDALQNIKQQRVNTFSNFDAYNSTAISQNGVVFQRGDYVILLMIADQDNVRATLEKYIPR